MKDYKKLLFSENEDNVTWVTREQLVEEIRRVTNLDIPVKRKILEIDYLISHYFDDDKPKSKWHCAKL